MCGGAAGGHKGGGGSLLTCLMPVSSCGVKSHRMWMGTQASQLMSSLHTSIGGVKRAWSVGLRQFEGLVHGAEPQEGFDKGLCHGAADPAAAGGSCSKGQSLKGLRQQGGLAHARCSVRPISRQFFPPYAWPMTVSMPEDRPTTMERPVTL